MFISPAYAQAAAPGGGGATDILVSIVPFVFIMVIMWIMIIRPQRQAQKKHAESLSNIRRGDTVVAGGFIGKVTKVASDTELEVEIADNVKVRVVRSQVTEVRAKGEPVPAKD